MYGKTERAIIIGGGIAGLMTAKVLSEYFQEVTIVEKDDLPGKPENRLGIPQGFHPHRFTPRGKSITERLFPGYEEDLKAQGCPSSLNKTIHQMNQYGSIVGPYPRDDIKFSRAVLEWVLRQRVRKISNVRFLTKHDVINLLSTPDHSTITGIRVRERGQQEQEKILTADIVLDTSGRSSKLAKWLEELGYDVPTPDLLKVDLGYSTRRYQLPPHLTHIAEKWDVINIAGQPANSTFTGVFSFVENQTAEVCLYRPGGHYPPTNIEQFNEAITELPSPIIAEILQGLVPITTPRGYRIQQLYRHHYEQMQQWPSGLIVLGDAFCIFDPIFGQGMTVAAVEVEMIELCLQEQQDDPHPHFEKKVLKKIQEVIEPAWWYNCAADLQWEGVAYVGSEPLKGIDFGQKYMDLFLKHATIEQDSQLYGLYWAVNTLAISPNAIMNPQMVMTILKASTDGNQFLAELLQDGSQSLEKVLDEILPSFSETLFESVSL